MKTTPLLTLSILTLLGHFGSPLSAQEVKPVAKPQEQERESSLPTMDPRYRAYFQAMGIETHHFRHLTAIGRNRQRLEYSLHSVSPYTLAAQRAERRELTIHLADREHDDEDFGLGRIGFSERWLMAYLNRCLPELEDMEIVDLATGRTRGGPPLTSLERSIVLTGPTAVIQSAVQLLDEYAETTRYPVVLDCRVFWREALKTPEAVALSVLDEAAFTERLRAASQGAQLIGHQIITATAHQPAHFASLDQIAYVQDFKLETVPGTEGTALIADPIIGVIADGLLMNLTPLVDPDGETLHLSASVELARIRRPIANHDLDIGTGHPVSIQLPELSTVRWSSDELSLGSADYGFQVMNLQYFDWSEEGETLPRTLEVLIHARVIRPGSTPGGVLGEVIGFDAAAHLAFVRRGTDAALDEEETPVTFLRGGKSVATGVTVEVQPTMLVIRVEQGEPRAGDAVKR